MICELCGEPLEPGERADVRPLVAHRACLLRSIMGGIGHLLDHEFWCNHMKDPDAGLTYKESADAVVAWIDWKSHE